jgi:hypothetical protein
MAAPGDQNVERRTRAKFDADWQSKGVVVASRVFPRAARMLGKGPFTPTSGHIGEPIGDGKKVPYSDSPPFNLESPFACRQLFKGLRWRYVAALL